MSNRVTQKQKDLDKTKVSSTDTTAGYLLSKFTAGYGIGFTQNNISGNESITIRNTLTGAIVYQGTWNASTNSPTLASGVGTQGFYYLVSVAGTTNLDGHNLWNVGDWAVFDGTVWERISSGTGYVPYTGAITNVNLGANSLTATGITNSSLTSGSVLFAGASGLESQDNTNFTWDNTNKVLTVGNATGAALSTSQNINAINNVNSFSGFYTQNLSNLTGASTDVIGANDLGASNYFDLGINSSTVPAGGILGGNSTVYLYSHTSPFVIGTDSAQPLTLFTNSAARMTILGNGNVGIGTTAPTHTLTLGSTSTGLASYNTSDQTTNYERVRQYWNSNVYLIASEAGGTGTTRPIQLNSAGRTITINGAGQALYNFGGTNTTGITAYPVFQTSSISTASSGTYSALAINDTINQTSTAAYRGLWISPYEQALGSGTHYLIDAGTNTAAQGGGTHTSKFVVDDAGTGQFAGRVAIGTISGTSGALYLGGNISSSASFGTTVGSSTVGALGIGAQTYSSTTSSGTIGTTGINTISIPTLAASNATTLTNAASMYIDGAPTAGTNVTITNPYSLYVNSGVSYLSGGFGTSSGARVSIGLSSSISQLSLSNGNSTGSAFSTTTGVGLNINAQTYNSSAAGTTIATMGVNTIGIPTLTNSNATTLTNAATLYIDGAPTASGSTTITNPYALIINSGSSYFGGALVAAGSIGTTASSGTSNFLTAGSSGTSSTTTSNILFGGASSVGYRVILNGSTSSALTTGQSYGNMVIGSSPITTFTSGTHAWLANEVINPIGTVTSGGAAVTNTASLYIGGASSAGTNNYALYVASGNSFFGGTVTLKGYTVATLPTGTVGMTAYITDGDAGLAWGATAVNSGGSSTKYLVWYSGSAWTVVGK